MLYHFSNNFGKPQENVHDVNVKELIDCNVTTMWLDYVQKKTCLVRRPTVFVA